MTEKFLNVHEIMNEAALESKEERTPLVTQTFKLPKKDKELVARICQANGTTVSKFYQKCTQVLIADYGVKSTDSESQE
jgi:hypothetical protein